MKFFYFDTLLYFFIGSEMAILGIHIRVTVEIKMKIEDPVKQS